MVRVDSEALAEVLYEPATCVLRIRFRSGDWYRYFGVPASVHAALMAAESHGRFFQEHIRGRYPYRRG